LILLPFLPLKAVKVSRIFHINLSLYPSHHQTHNQINFLIIQNFALLYPMPFLNTTPATGGGGVLPNCIDSFNLDIF
jgi:hypothetical protein